MGFEDDIKHTVAACRQCWKAKNPDFITYGSVNSKDAVGFQQIPGIWTDITFAQQKHEKKLSHISFYVGV